MAFSADNRKIAKNTLILYMRQILIIFVSLYTSRVILRTLGADDYGIYNVVGGFVAMFNVVSGAFTVAISRFMAYVIGEGDEKKLEDLFSTALLVQFVIGAIIVIMLGVIGVWYVSSIMVLPEGRTAAALWVLLFSTISFFINLISVPYNALIVAHEHMKAFAYISIFEVVMKLIVAFLIVISPIDRLVFYSFLTVLTAVIVRFSYSIYCNRHFSGCRFRLKFHHGMLESMMSFVGWAFLGNGAVVIRDQGTNMILNLFGGTVVNAARGIGQSVNSAVQGFVNNFMQATQPEITKLCATDQLVQMRQLILRSCRLCYCLMLAICIPLIKNIDYILVLWLGEVPQYTAIFIVLTLVDSAVSSINNPLLYGVLAKGRIKVYEIVLSTLCLLCMPVIYGVLEMGGSPVSAYVILIILRVLILLTLVWQSKVYGLKWGEFIKEVMVRVVLVSVLCFLGMRIVELSMIGIDLLRFIVESALVTAIDVCIIFFIGMTGSERKRIVAIITEKIIPHLKKVES